MTQSTDPTRNAAPDVWGLARDDYLSGASGPVVAERYGLTLRSIRRRAAKEGWRRADTPSADIHPDWPRPVERGCYGPRRTMDDMLQTWPELDSVVQVNTAEKGDLLLDPDPGRLRHYAFKKAAESAAMERPSETLAWMRVVNALDRSGDRIDREARCFSDADRARGAYIGTLARHMQAHDEGRTPHDDAMDGE